RYGGNGNRGDRDNGNGEYGANGITQRNGAAETNGAELGEFDGSGCFAARRARPDRIAKTNTTRSRVLAFAIRPVRAASLRDARRTGEPPFNLRSSVSPFVIPFAPSSPLPPPLSPSPRAPCFVDRLLVRCHL